MFKHADNGDETKTSDLCGLTKAMTAFWRTLY